MLNQDQVIELLVQHLAFRRYPGLRVTSWPDKQPGATGEIDAVAEVLVAIEHTSIDTVVDQRLDTDRFMRAVGELEAEFKNRLPCRIEVTIDFGAVPTGVSWEGIRAILAAWLAGDWQVLPEGKNQYTLTGVPFPVTIVKNSGNPNPGVFVARFTPPGYDDMDLLVQRVRSQLQRKAAKLGNYKASGFWTLLLIESNDIGLMSMGKLRQVVIQAFPDGLPNNVDEVWCMHTGIPDSPEFACVTRADIGRPRPRKTNERECPHCSRVIAIQVAGAHGDSYYAVCPEPDCGKEIALEVIDNEPGTGSTIRILRT